MLARANDHAASACRVHSGEAGMKWRKIETMPDNILVLLGVTVQHTQQPEPHTEYYIAMYDPESGTMLNQASEADLPWEKEDFDCWAVLPPLEPTTASTNTQLKESGTQLKDALKGDGE